MRGGEIMRINVDDWMNDTARDLDVGLNALHTMEQEESGHFYP
jgi:hypothetical protein